MVQTFKQLHPRRMKLPFMFPESDNIDGDQCITGGHGSTN